MPVPFPRANFLPSAARSTITHGRVPGLDLSHLPSLSDVLPAAAPIASRRTIEHSHSVTVHRTGRRTHKCKHLFLTSWRRGLVGSATRLFAMEMSAATAGFTSYTPSRRRQVVPLAKSFLRAYSYQELLSSPPYHSKSPALPFFGFLLCDIVCLRNGRFSDRGVSVKMASDTYLPTPRIICQNVDRDRSTYRTYYVLIGYY